ncbi:MAG TPA: type II toxin-antitoxin system VapC family toxin [Candidatus Dormibacteraeota bacterium]|nr:type II toxin-antitoxin system VapC family toxin [Candidatus Dormibacteraeota bacterium]
MIVLDTNVISALMRKEPEKPVVKWLDGQPAASVWITAITVMEIRFGLQIMPKGRRQDGLIRSFELMLKSMIEGRIASFDAEAGSHAAELMAQRKRIGRPAEVRDTMIAGIVLANRATLATRNVQHFEDLPVTVINPWEV